MSVLTFESLNDHMLAVAPSVADEYAEWVADWVPDPVHPLLSFGCILMPYLIDQLATAEDDGELRVNFDLFEAMARHPDEQVTYVVWVSVVEHLLGWLTGPSLSRAIRLMGPATRDAARVVAEGCTTKDEILGLLAELERGLSTG